MRGGSSPGRRIAVAVLVLATLALGASQAFATGSVIVADDSTTDYATPNPDLTFQGDVATFINNGSVTHTVTADDDGPDGKPLFRTGDTPPGTINRPVRGTNFLSTGFYGFHCSIHPAMEGTLEVHMGGAPQARPSIEVTVKSKKLERVAKSGKLKVKVSADQPTDAEGISLSAKKGRKGITKKANLELLAGNTKTAKLKLKKSAAEKLADLDKAKVKVSATVDFGFGDKASKKLK